MSKTPKEFEKFYNDNIDKIYRFVFFRIGQNKELAEDLVSEIFLKALRGFEKFDEKISISAWIYTIAKNHLANHWRDIKPTISLDDEGISNIAENPLWLKQAISEFQKFENKNEIYDILANLDEADQEIVTFHYLFGYSYLEIAKMKEMTEEAVKVASHRAIKKMRKLV